jgi:hypothetical protein
MVRVMCPNDCHQGVSPGILHSKLTDKSSSKCFFRDFKNQMTVLRRRLRNAK